MIERNKGRKRTAIVLRKTFVCLPLKVLFFLFKNIEYERVLFA